MKAARRVRGAATATLPPLYAAWAAEFLTGPIPAETRSTCDDCAMCDSGNDLARGSSLFFDPRVKCCSYQPRLANFLVGRILADEDPGLAHGRASVQARIDAIVAVSPLGLGQLPSFTALYQKTAAREFGRSFDLRCPHFVEQGDSGHCGIWKHRPSVCATWHCKFVRGATGAAFWQGLHQLLSTVEETLSRWCVLQLDPGTAALQVMFPSPYAKPSVDAPDDAPDLQAHRAVWGTWRGRESEFYRECARQVEALSWTDVLAIGGPDLHIAARLVGDKYRDLTSKALAQRLRVGSFQALHTDPQGQRVSSYSGNDPIEVPTELMELLDYFDGRPVTEALRAMESDRAVRIDRGTLRRLVDFRLLVDSSASDTTKSNPRESTPAEGAASGSTSA